MSVRKNSKEYDFFSHQPYLENNTSYINYRPKNGDTLKGIVWEAYQVDNYDSTKDIAFPDICADVMTLYTPNKSYSYFMGGTESSRSMKELDFIDDVHTICGIKFCPGALGNIFTEELCDAAGTTIDANTIMYQGNRVTRDLSNAETFNERIQVMNNYIMKRLQEGYEADAFSGYVTKRIVGSHGLANINEIAEETGYTDRYLRRVMNKRLGMGMKTFSQIVQMQWAYHLRNEELNTGINLAYLAQLCGYYDQSHMNASYKKLTGMLPKDAFGLYDESI